MRTEIVFNLNVSHGTLHYIWDVYRKDNNLYIGKVKFNTVTNQYVFAPNGPLIVFDSEMAERKFKFTRVNDSEIRVVQVVDGKDILVPFGFFRRSEVSGFYSFHFTAKILYESELELLAAELRKLNGPNK